MQEKHFIEFNIPLEWKLLANRNGRKYPPSDKEFLQKKKKEYSKFNTFWWNVEKCLSEMDNKARMFISSLLLNTTLMVPASARR